MGLLPLTKVITLVLNLRRSFENLSNKFVLNACFTSRLRSGKDAGGFGLFVGICCYNDLTKNAKRKEGSSEI